jgi:hypothetical protein
VGLDPNFVIRIQPADGQARIDLGDPFSQKDDVVVTAVVSEDRRIAADVNGYR